MAGSKTDAGADAVALAIRDLTAELRRTNRILCLTAAVDVCPASCRVAERLFEAVVLDRAFYSGEV